jgi:hypothetical protein
MPACRQAGYLLIKNFYLPNQPELQTQRPNEAVFVELLVILFFNLILRVRQNPVRNIFNN